MDDNTIIKNINRGMLVAYTVTVIGGALYQSDVLQFDPIVASKVAQSVGSTSGASSASMFIAHEFNNLITGDVYKGTYRHDLLERPAFIRGRDYASWPLLASGSEPSTREIARKVVNILST
jgi:hypothetical protein